MAKLPSILYQRQTYIDKIVPFMRTPIVKVMVGHRRVGKSYILFQLIDRIKREEQHANVIYINKEDIEFIDITSYKELHDYISARLVNERRNYIFVDEIQEIDDFSIAIRSLALNDNNDIYITGSNSEMFSSDLANKLGGRYVEFRIYSLSYLEFLNFHHLPNNDESLEKYALWRAALFNPSPHGGADYHGVHSQRLLYHRLTGCDRTQEDSEHRLFRTIDTLFSQQRG